MALKIQYHIIISLYLLYSASACCSRNKRHLNSNTETHLNKPKMSDTSSATLVKNIENFLEEFSNGMSDEQKKSLKGAKEEIKKISTPLNVELIRDALKLMPHPEGGYFGEIARSEQSTVIFYLLGSQDTSSWHRLKNIEEEWRIFSGSPIQLPWINQASGKYEEKTLSFNKSEFFENGNPGVWFGAYVENNYSLVICICRPPFEYHNWELISLEELARIINENPEKELEVKRIGPK